MSPDSSTTPRADEDGTGPVPAKAAASLRGRAVLVVGCRGRMGAMLCRRGKAAGLDMRGVDVPLTDAVLAPACKDAALALLCVPAAVFADVAATVCAHLPATAILATSPGGLQAVVGMASDLGTNAPAVLAFHLVRLYTVLLLAPFLGWLLHRLLPHS